MNVFTEQLRDGLKAIGNLQEVKYFAFHRVEDPDGWEFDQVSVIAEDVTGYKVEISLPTRAGTLMENKNTFNMNLQVAKVLVNLLVRRVCSEKGANVEPAFNMYLKTNDINVLIEAGRIAAPYTGPTYINEEQARFSWVVHPEYMW